MLFIKKLLHLDADTKQKDKLKQKKDKTSATLPSSNPGSIKKDSNINSKPKPAELKSKTP